MAFAAAEEQRPIEMDDGEHSVEASVATLSTVSSNSTTSSGRTTASESSLPEPPMLVSGPPSPSRVLNVNNPTAGDENNLFIGDLAKELTEDELITAFSVVGTVLEASIKRDKQTGKNLGYGFVRMASQQEAQSAKDQLHELELKGRQIRVGWAMKNTCLFALDLCPTVTSQMLRDVFRQFGNLVEDETMIRKGKGLGLIRFQTRSSAENARRAMNGAVLGHYPLNIAWTFKATSTRGRDSPVMPGQGMYAHGHSVSSGSLQNLGYSHQHSSSTGSPTGLYDMQAQQQYAFHRSHSASPPHMRYKQSPPHHQQSQQQRRGSRGYQRQHSTPSPQFGGMATMYDPRSGSPMHMMPPPQQQQQGHPQHPQMYPGQYPHSQPTFDQYGQPMVPYMPQHPGFPVQQQMQPIVPSVPMGDSPQPIYSNVASTASLGSMDRSGHGHHQQPQAAAPPQQQKQTKFMSSVQVSVLVPTEVANADVEGTEPADGAEAAVADAEAGDGEGEGEGADTTTVDEETNSEAEPLDDKRIEQVIWDLFGKFGVVAGVTLLKPKPSKSSPEKELVAVVHFEPSALGEQLALAAYTGLNGTACHMKSEDTLSTLSLARCMPKTRGKGRSSMKGQAQQGQQAQQSGTRSPQPPQQAQQPPQKVMHPGMAPMYGSNGMVVPPQYSMDPRMQGGVSPMQGHPVDANEAEDAMRRRSPQPGQMPRGMPLQPHMMQPGYSYPQMYQMGPNGPVPMVPAPGHMSYVPQDPHAPSHGGHPQHQYPPHFQHQYPQHPQHFAHQDEQQEQGVRNQPAAPMSSVLDAASAARHNQTEAGEKEDLDEAVLVHELEAGLELDATTEEEGSQDASSEDVADEATPAPAVHMNSQ